MSGGDLDGDVYMVIWDHEIVSAATKMDIPKAAEPPEEWKLKYTEDLSHEMRTSIADSIINYFKRDILGQTSNLHLALAINEGLQDEDT